MANNPFLSVVVPFYNEEELVEELYTRLKTVLVQLKKSYEIIFVNDGSKDKTPAILDRLYDKDDCLMVIHLRTNFGQTAALAAGFDAAQGDIIISMDGDLQHQPEEIPQFIDKINEGYDIVSGWRKKRVDNLWLRRIPSRVANWMMAKLSGVKLHDFGTTFKAYRNEIIKNVELYGELHRFIPALASSMGVEIYELPIKNIVRPKGKSKYGISRVRRVFFDLLTVKFLISFLDRPLQMFGFVGLFFSSIGFLIGGAISLLYFFNDLQIKDHYGNLLLAVALVLIGLNFISMGIIAEVNSRIYYRVHKKKPYAVKRTLSHKTKS
jgi:glycosyltransferase involved in cell wall biosynthesis